MEKTNLKSVNSLLLSQAQSSDMGIRAEAVEALMTLWQDNPDNVTMVIKKLITHPNRNGFLTVEQLLHQIFAHSSTSIMTAIQEWSTNAHWRFRLMSAKLCALLKDKHLASVKTILFNLSQDSHKEVRWEATLVLSSKMTLRNIKIVESWLYDPDPEIRWIGGKTLIKILLSTSTPTSVLSILQSLLKESDEDVRWSAGMAALRELIDKDPTLALSLLKDYAGVKVKQNHFVINLLEQLWPIPNLKETLPREWTKSSNRYIRQCLIQSLDTYPLSGSLELLEEMSKAKYADIRVKVAELLGKLYNLEKNAGILIILHKLQKDKSKTVRSVAQDTLKSIRI